MNYFEDRFVPYYWGDKSCELQMEIVRLASIVVFFQYL